jgi:hypothetical protein
MDSMILMLERSLEKVPVAEAAFGFVMLTSDVFYYISHSQTDENEDFERARRYNHNILASNAPPLPRQEGCFEVALPLHGHRGQLISICNHLPSPDQGLQMKTKWETTSKYLPTTNVQSDAASEYGL